MKVRLTFLLMAVVSLLLVAQGAGKRDAGAMAPAPAAPTISIAVDASEAPRKIFHSRLVIPVKPGPLTLYYPKWIPGEHGPVGPIVDLGGLKITAGGKPLEWRRDLVDMYAFHVQVPAGANQLEVGLDYLSPAGGLFTAGGSATAEMTVVSWNQLLLYPEGSGAAGLRFAPTLRLPAGWKFGSSLQPKNPGAESAGAAVEFEPVSLEMLVDAPVIAGSHYRLIPLSGGNGIRHQIDAAADSEAALGISPELTQKYSALVAEAGRMFGARHYRHYEFLLSLSDHVAHFGLEHHESSDDRVSERSLVNDELRKLMAGLLPHEFVHSWNGKYRRPADLSTPDFQQPMRTELLWVYEGLTQYLGYVLEGRSQLLTPAEMRENLALTAAYLDHRPGRTWRSLADTAVAAQLLYGSPGEWESWRRSTDFYDESLLIWLEADTIIRRQSGGTKSLDDFCHLFHGGQSGPPRVVPYTFDDVVNTMNQVVAYDWRKFFTDRLNSHGPGAPLGGIEGGGWKLVYSDARPEMLKTREKRGHFTSATYSLGISVNDETGRILDAVPDMPAAQAGIGPGMRLVAVNGRKWSPDVIRDALGAAKNGAPLELLVENSEYFRTYKLNYAGGERYPRLERDASKPDLLSEILKPTKAAASGQ